MSKTFNNSTFGSASSTKAKIRSANSGGSIRGSAYSPVTASRGVTPRGTISASPLQSRPFKAPQPVRAPQPAPVSAEFNGVIARLLSAATNEDGDFKPQSDVVQATHRLLVEAQRLLNGRFALASVAVDEDGSLAVYWRKPGRTVHLTIPLGGAPYLYHRDSKGHGTEKGVSAPVLARWLAWYMEV